MNIHLFHQTRIFESNTRIFSFQKGRKLGKELAWEYLSLPEMKVCDYLWAMGIWQVSPASVSIARKHPGLLEEFKTSLPNLETHDIIGSPFAVYDYIPNRGICDGFHDLKEFHQTLKDHGKKLILDFVPNHMAVDSPWIEKTPKAFLEATKESLDHNHFSHPSGRVFAHGRDPYFDGWTDTVQFDFSSEEALDLHRKFLKKISDYCDGLRCDMAMLPLSDVFQRTHGKPSLPFYWEEMIRATKKDHPDFLFIAEVYWNMESRLQEIGFDLTYDKDLYDHLKHKNREALVYHLNADKEYTSRSLHFLENHDEPRSNSVFFRDSIHFFSLLAFLPGALLLHEGQMQGYRKRIPVQLGRSPKEEIDFGIFRFYESALHILQSRNSSEEVSPSFILYGQSSETTVFTRMLQNEILIFNPNSFPVSGRLTPDNSWWDKTFPNGRIEFYDPIYQKHFHQERKDVFQNGFYFALEPFHSHWLVAHLA